MLRGVKYLAAAASFVCFGVALHEWSYAGDHPHAYGPAKVITALALAGCALGIALAVAIGQLESDKREIWTAINKAYDRERESRGV
jgi:hypothetical protein